MKILFGVWGLDLDDSFSWWGEVHNHLDFATVPKKFGPWMFQRIISLLICVVQIRGSCKAESSKLVDSSLYQRMPLRNGRFDTLIFVCFAASTTSTSSSLQNLVTRK